MTGKFVTEITHSVCYRWPAVLSALNIRVPDHHRHGPCPICGGKDRFRFDDLEGRGTWFCNQCRAGDGLDLVAKVHRCSLTEAAKLVASVGDRQATLPAREKAQSSSPDISEKVSALLSRCACGESPYLQAKGYQRSEHILTEGAPVHIADAVFGQGSLVLTLRDSKGDVTGAQLISPAGDKRLLPGSRLKGCFIALPAGDDHPDIAVTEGYATALAVQSLTGVSTYAALSANNLLHVARALREEYPHARLILAGDNDNGAGENTGRKQAEYAARQVNGFAVWPPGDIAADWDDYLRHNGRDVARRTFYSQLSSMAMPIMTPDNHELVFTSTLPLRRGSEGYDARQDYLIKGHLAGHSLCSIYGASGSYKSFLAVSWACHIATGKPWANRLVNQGAVIYVVGEGGIGVPRRIRAWEQTLNGSSPVDTLFRVDCPVFPASSESVKQVIQAANDVKRETGMPVRLIILDTLARCFGGSDENTAKDMGAFIQGCDTIKAATQASVLIVHHSGKDLERGARGSSAFQAALDTEFNVRRESSGNALVLSCTKMKDAEPPAPAAYDLTPVTVYVDEDGEPVDSLVLNDRPRELRDGTDAYPELAGISHLTANHIAVWQALKAREVCTRSQLRDDLRAKGLNVDKKFTRWLLKLEKDGLIELEGETVRLAGYLGE
ncbi:AAA family ATPase [Pectobacterium cacticida]